MHLTKKPGKPMNDTEKRGKEIALAYERERIQKSMGEAEAGNVREVGEGGGYEIVSPDGRTIEVKAAEHSHANHGFVLNSEQEMNHLQKGGFIYRITDVFGKSPHINILSKEHLDITRRFRADVRIRRDSNHEVVVVEQENIE